ncbi:MAG: DsrE family protein [Candidatus Omnitrophica bacterium]|nr:DsrE family protein [Candidatus Omnitrophota bacterium]
MLKIIFGVLLCIMALVIVTPPTYAAGKYAVILQAGKESHEGTARAVHAFLYARELKEHGHEVVLIFDGAGTEWIEELSNPESSSGIKPAYEAVRKLGITEIICDFCSVAFGVKDRLSERKLPLVAEFEGHPSIAKWADAGYQLIVL